MNPWHRWSLFAVAVPFLAVGMLAAHEAIWWMSNPLARCAVFSGGWLLFGFGIALVEGATRRD